MSQDFAVQCSTAAKGLRRVQPALRRELSSRVKDEVAVPLANRIRSAAGSTGPWAKVLGPGTKARAGADPTIVIGGTSPRLSGGGGPRSVVFGTEFGGGKRITRVAAGNGHRGYRRFSTNQFRAHHKPFVFPTIEDNMDAVLDGFASIVMDTLEEAVNGG